MSATLPGDHPVDIELLADFAEGLLPPEAAADVQARVDGDPDWAATLALLRESAPAVGATLSTYADETASPMPADVVDRLTAALRAERVPSRADKPAKRIVAAPTDHRPGRSDASARPPASRPPSRRRPGSRSAWLRGVLAAVAVVLAVVGLGFLAKLVPSDTSTSSGSVASARDGVPPQLTGLPGLTVTSSGTDYTSLTFGASVPAPLAPSASSLNGGTEKAPDLSGPNAQGSGPKAQGGVPPALDRLLDPITLRTCLTKIEGLVGGTARSVDFATYHGAPAIIVVLASPAAAVAADPDCGLMSPVTSSHS